jgi:NhaP-type Na+/H+ and K+/H+ antiporter
MLITSGLIVGSLVYYLFDLPLLLCLLIGFILSSSSLHFHKHHYLSRLLEKESEYANAFVLLVTILIALVIRNSHFSFTYFSTQLLPFFEEIFMSVGLGLLIGIVFFRGINALVIKYDRFINQTYTLKKYTHYYFILAMVSVLITYVLSGHLRADPFLSVATTAFIFGYVFVKNRNELQEYPRPVIVFIEIAVFVLLGFLVRLPVTGAFYLTALYVYLMYLVVRYLVVYFCLKDVHSIKERIFITFNNPQSITTGSIILFLLFSFNGMQGVTALLFTFMVYSLVVSLAASVFARRIRLEIDYTERNFDHKYLKDIKRDARLHMKWFRGVADDDTVKKKDLQKAIRHERELMDDVSSQYVLDTDTNATSEAKKNASRKASSKKKKSKKTTTNTKRRKK